MGRRLKVLNDRWWWGLLVFALGVIIGAIVRIPLLPLPPLIEANAILIGSALGAAITVLGSQWLLTNHHRRERQLAAASIVDLIEPVKTSLIATIDQAGSFSPQPNDTSQWQSKSIPTQKAANKLMSALQHFDSRVHHMQGLFATLGAHGVLAFGDLIHLSKQISAQANKFILLVNSPPGGIASAIEEGEKTLVAQLAELRKILATLVTE